MRFGLSFGALYAPAAEVAALGAEAEAGGFGSLWVPDSPMLYRDPYATLGLLARETRTVLLGTLATNPLTRHPAVTASASVTLQELSGGRLRIGIATGDSAVRRLGAAPATIRDLETAVRELRALLRGGPGAGRFPIRFAAGPAPPIYVVASGPRALEAAGRVGDGVIVNVGLDPACLAAAGARVGAGARAAGRDPASVDLVVFAFCLVDPDRARARAGVKPSVSWLAQRFPALAATAGQPLDAGTRAALARFAADYARYDLVHADEWARAVEAAAFLPDSLVDAFALAGAPADVAARVSDLAAAGVRHLVIRPPSRDAWRSTMRVFADGVIGGRSP